MKAVIGLILAIFWAGAAVAQVVGPLAEGGVGGFHALVVLSTDTKPQIDKIWQTDRSAAPKFDMLSKVASGQPLSFVAMVSGMTVDQGQAHVSCDVLLIMPDGGKEPVNLPDCLTGTINGPASDFYLLKGFSFAAPDYFVGLPMHFHVVIKDDISGASVPLDVAVEVAKGQG